MGPLLFVPIALGEGTKARKKEKKAADSAWGGNAGTPPAAEKNRRRFASAPPASHRPRGRRGRVAVASMCPFRKFPIREKCKHQKGIGMEDATGLYIFFFGSSSALLRRRIGGFTSAETSVIPKTLDLKKESKDEGLPVSLIQSDLTRFSLNSLLALCITFPACTGQSQLFCPLVQTPEPLKYSSISPQSISQSSCS